MLSLLLVYDFDDDVECCTNRSNVYVRNWCCRAMQDAGSVRSVAVCSEESLQPRSALIKVCSTRVYVCHAERYNGVMRV